MMYSGHARNVQEIEAAIELAANTFRTSLETECEHISIKRTLLTPYGILCESDVIVVVDDEGGIVGACFLIDRKLFRENRVLDTTFLTSICIKEEYRGRNLSISLMHSVIQACEERGAAIAVLIARRAVDHFYNKFSFWGLSQYSRISLPLQGLMDPGLKAVFTSETASEAHLSGLVEAYNNTYSELYGACVRSTEYWRYIVKKAAIDGLEFQVFKQGEEVAGYVIYSGQNIFELASIRSPCLPIVKELAVEITSPEVVLHLSPEHKLVNELRDLDFSIALRQCVYGGHMVRVIDPQKLRDTIRADNEISQNIEPGRNESSHQIKPDGGASGKQPAKPRQYDFEETLRLLGAAYLSDPNTGVGGKSGISFNLPLMDQL